MARERDVGLMKMLKLFIRRKVTLSSVWDVAIVWWVRLCDQRGMKIGPKSSAGKRLVHPPRWRPCAMRPFRRVSLSPDVVLSGPGRYREIDCIGSSGFPVRHWIGAGCSVYPRPASGDRAAGFTHGRFSVFSAGSRPPRSSGERLLFPFTAALPPIRYAHAGRKASIATLGWARPMDGW